MKKLLSILLIAVLALSIVGCTQTGKEEIVLPPTRYGLGIGLVDYYTNDISYYYAEADVVARVKVGNWLWEDHNQRHGGCTYFEAQTLECYKGTLPENFTLAQSATSAEALEGPIFTYGQEKLLFLYASPPGQSPYKNTYGCSGYTAMEVSYSNAGDKYFLVSPLLGGSITRTTPLTKIPVSEVRENARKRDPILSESAYATSHVFSEEDIKLFFASLEQEEIVPLPERGTGVLPPTRFTRRGGGPGAYWQEEEDIFEVIYAEADVVVRLIVGDWLGENAELQATYYEATVLDTFKGEIPENFILKQNGYSQEGATLLFAYGNEVLLFLKEDEDPNYKNAYTDFDDIAVLDISYDDEGQAYYLARYDNFGATVPCQTLGDHGDTYDIYKNLLEQDLMISVLREARWGEVDRYYPYTFPVSDLNAWFDKNG